MASLFSNHQAPGRDIAIQFASGVVIAFIFSGGSWLADQHHCVTSGRNVLELFKTKKYVQDALGVDDSWTAEKQFGVKRESF